MVFEVIIVKSNAFLCGKIEKYEISLSLLGFRRKLKQIWVKLYQIGKCFRYG